jgi:hypothetical protein
MAFIPCVLCVPWFQNRFIDGSVAGVARLRRRCRGPLRYGVIDRIGRAMGQLDSNGAAVTALALVTAYHYGLQLQDLNVVRSVAFRLASDLGKSSLDSYPRWIAEPHTLRARNRDWSLAGSHLLPDSE